MVHIVLLELYEAEIQYMSHLMGKPTICKGKNKDADQLRGNREADQRLCFRYSDSTIPLLHKSPKFQDSSSFLCLYRPVCVGPVWKPHCWFSHETAHILMPLLPFQTNEGLRQLLQMFNILEKYGRHLLKPADQRSSMWRHIKNSNAIFRDRVARIWVRLSGLTAAF